MDCIGRMVAGFFRDLAVWGCAVNNFKNISEANEETTMNTDNLWDYDEPATDYFNRAGISAAIPAWIDQDITPVDIAAIIQGGCASGAYMPAVTYYTAKQVMAEHGDDVLEYIEDCLGELPSVEGESSWSGIAVLFLSTAVELWADSIADALVEALETIEEADNADDD